MRVVVCRSTYKVRKVIETISSPHCRVPMHVESLVIVLNELSANWFKPGRRKVVKNLKWYL